MDSESGFLEVNGARLYYELAGAGPPVALLHSGSTGLWVRGVLTRPILSALGALDTASR